MVRASPWKEQQLFPALLLANWFYFKLPQFFYFLAWHYLILVPIFWRFPLQSTYSERVKSLQRKNKKFFRKTSNFSCFSNFSKLICFLKKNTRSGKLILFIHSKKHTRWVGKSFALSACRAWRDAETICLANEEKKNVNEDEKFKEINMNETLNIKARSSGRNDKERTHFSNFSFLLLLCLYWLSRAHDKW